MSLSSRTRTRIESFVNDIRAGGNTEQLIDDVVDDLLDMDEDQPGPSPDQYRMTRDDHLRIAALAQANSPGMPVERILGNAEQFHAFLTRT